MSEGTGSVEMPRYKCHKVVHALKIKHIVVKTGNGAEITPDDKGCFAVFSVSEEYMVKHNPQPGGYFVVYEDGYASFSPAKAFEAGYTRI